MHLLQAVQLAKFFSIFYFSINAGSFISTILTPILREEVHCFGETSCFSLAFGIPGILMIVATVIFILGRPIYRIKKPEGNMIVLSSKCIGHALSQRIKHQDPSKQHWMDYANDRFDYKLIEDIKATLKVLWLYLPFPLFWALFDQQGTGWTFMATRMSGDIGFTTILPDQMQVANPIIILILIPVFETVIYPSLARFNLLTKPLQRLTVGGILAAVAFLISGILQMQIESTYPVLPADGEAQLRFYNSLPCPVTVSGLGSGGMSVPAFSLLAEKHLDAGKTKYEMEVDVGDCNSSLPKKSRVGFGFNVTSKGLYGQVVRFEKGSVVVSGFQDDIDKSTNGYPLVR